MQTFTVEGVILNTVDFGSANRVVTIYTKELGKLEVNAYGCRRARSNMSGAIQMFNLVRAEIKRGVQVDSIREVDVVNFYPNLTADIERLGYAAVFFEIVNKMMLPKIVDVGVYNLLVGALPALDGRNPQIAALIAIAQFMEFTGFQLNFTSCVRCGNIIEGEASLSFGDGGAVCERCSHGAVLGIAYPENLRKTFKAMLHFDWRADAQVMFSSRQINAAQKILFQYVQNILGQELRAMNFLRQIHD